MRVQPMAILRGVRDTDVRVGGAASVAGVVTLTSDPDGVLHRGGARKVVLKPKPKFRLWKDALNVKMEDVFVHNQDDRRILGIASEQAVLRVRTVAVLSRPSEIEGGKAGPRARIVP